MNNQKIAQLYRQIADEFARQDAPQPPAPTQPSSSPNPQHLPVGDIKVLVTFGAKNHEWAPPIDVMINGEWYKFYRRSQNSPLWNQHLNGSRGQVIEVNAPIRNIRFLEEQIYDSNHNGFHYKIGAVPSDADLTAQNTIDGHANYWARWFRVNNDPNQQLADHVSVHGSISGKINVPFYEYENIPVEWSQTGNFRIIVSR